MNKITRRLATTAATLAVASGVILTGGGAASAATDSASGNRHDTVSVSVKTVSVKSRDNSASRRWDGKRWWNRANNRGYWYSSHQGNRYRFNGHSFYRWSGGKWKVLTTNSARRHHLDRSAFKSHHGNRYRFKGHSSYRWSGGKWKALATDSARRHHRDRGAFKIRTGYGH